MKPRRLLRRMITILAFSIAALVLGIWSYTRLPQFGRLPTGSRLAATQHSTHYRDGAFRNDEPTPVFTATSTQKRSRLGGLYDFLFVKKPRLRPDAPLPVHRTDLKSLPRERDVVVWLGHSSFFVQFGGRRFLIDPVFSDYAAPVSFANRAFAGTSLYTAEDMPDIDYLLISHDHWDHLDYVSVKALRSKVGQVITGLGVGAHFDRWGYSPEQIREGDWFDTFPLSDSLKLHLIPARHFSGRLFTRNQSLWVGFVLETPTRRILFSGDSGYGSHFAEIGRRFPGFDLVVLDTGQYDPQWAHVHMFPEETARAAVDLGARALLPAHIGRFSISNHAWDDPFDRIVAASADKPYRLLTPTIGTAVALEATNDRFPPWWKSAAP